MTKQATAWRGTCHSLGKFMGQGAYRLTLGAVLMPMTIS